MVKNLQVDGFAPRRASRFVSTNAHTSHALPIVPVTNLQRHATVPQDKVIRGSSSNALTPIQQHGLSRSDIDESLSQIDRQATGSKTSKYVRGGSTRHKQIRRKIIKWAIIVLVSMGIIMGAWVAVKALIASKSVFKGDIFGLVQQKKLQQDSNGRTNILILGTSEDDPGHDAGYLTDSMMILSVDQTNKNAYMISIPRDLYVKYGRSCQAGYAGKINAYFQCVNDGTSSADEEQRQTEIRSFVGSIFGLDIQYSVHVNYTVMRDVVNAVGNITVNIEGDGAPGIMDSNFDWKCKGGNAYASHATMVKNCPPNGHFIEYKNGPAVLDAEHALYLAQARGDVEPTYGLANSNFDREQNQQKIIVAIKEKAMSSGTLTDITKVTKLIDAIGNNLRTNFDTSEVRTLVSLAKEIPSSSIASVNMLTATPTLFTTQTMAGAGSSVVPAAGVYDYTALRTFVHKTLYATGLTKEDAHVMVLNASGVSGAAQAEVDKLTVLGMDAGAYDAPDGTYTTNVIYQVNHTNKPLSAAKLTSLYGVKPQTVTSVPGVTIDGDTNFVVILATSGLSSTNDTSTR